MSDVLNMGERKVSDNTEKILFEVRQISERLENVDLGDHTAILGSLQVLHQRRVLHFQQEQQRLQQENQQKAYEAAVKAQREAKFGVAPA
jgi:hypothetical protein